MLTAIETRYAGCRFRSRTEARYALLLDHLGIRWEYEAQGYETSAGPYLPDFELTLITGKVFFEVKPEEARTHPADRRWIEMANIQPVYVAFGMPRIEGSPADPFDPEWMQKGLDRIKPDGSAFRPSFFNRCTLCGGVGIGHHGVLFRYANGTNRESGYISDCCEKPFTAIREATTGPWSAEMVKAYTAARSARFEHGECG
jgi:hypothetical protein